MRSDWDDLGGEQREMIKAYVQVFGLICVLIGISAILGIGAGILSLGALLLAIVRNEK